MADQGSDVASTLNELERKLRALERDLQSAFADSPPPDRPPVEDAPDPEQLVARARLRIEELRSELDELARTREQATYEANPISGYPGASAGSFAQPPIAPLPQALPPEHTVQQGAVVIEAGFFRDITSLGTFEQSIARVPGVIGVHVRTLEQGRAIIDAHLSHPIPLGAELARYAPLRFTVTGAGPQHLMLAISG